jgi:hypothetical protein
MTLPIMSLMAILLVHINIYYKTMLDNTKVVVRSRISKDMRCNGQTDEQTNSGGHNATVKT